MDDLPELPFEKVLSYLNLKDRLKARTVSRAWRNKFDSFPVKTLCFSQRPMNRIRDNKRWVSEAFAKNFINSTCFITFFDTFGQTILSSLKRLRLCDLDLSEGDQEAFARILNSFGQLEQLDIIRAILDRQDEFNLNLPMLISLHLENVEGIENLILEAPRLRDVKIWSCLSCSRVEVVHGESVERLLVDWCASIEVKKLKNLQYLYVEYHEGIDSTFLSSLQQLKEFHTNQPLDVSKLFEQKQRFGRVDLKIYLNGLLLNGPDDPTINAFRDWLVCLAENRSRLADEIPLYHSLRYSQIEYVASSLAVDLLKRFTELKKVKVDRLVQDIESFLDLLKNFKNITELEFDSIQPQDLFDRLPERCAVQKLSINDGHPDLHFVFRLKHLIYLHVDCSIDGETVRRAFKELPILSFFGFYPGYHAIETCHPKQFTISFAGERKTTVSELNAAIELIFGKEEP